MGRSLSGVKVGAGAAGAVFVGAGAVFVGALAAAFAGAGAGAAGIFSTCPTLRSALRAMPLALARSARVTFSLAATLMRVSPFTMVRLPPKPTGPTGVSFVGTGVGMRAMVVADDAPGRAPPE